MSSSILFVAAMAVGSVFLLALTWMELEINWTGFKHIGESTIGRNSINWLAGIALLAAITICSLAN